MKYKICQIVNHAKIAGTEKHVLLLSSNLSKRDFICNVCSFESGDVINHLNEKKIKTKTIKVKNRILHLFCLIKYLYVNKFDIVHCHSGGYGCVAAKIAGIKDIIYTKHGVGYTQDELRKMSFTKKVSSFIVDKCVSMYIALTKADKEILVKFFKISPDKILVIPNGLNAPVLPVKKKNDRKEKVIGTVTRLMPQKGLRYFIEAIPEIIKFDNTIKFKIAGSGEQENELKELVNELNLNNNIEFMGYIINIISFIDDLDIFVLPSVWEGFPYVILEAMLMKKPIIATDIFGINEIIDNNINGILIKPKNPHYISISIIHLLKNPDLARKLGINAYSKAQREYTLEKNVRSIENLYNKLLNK